MNHHHRPSPPASQPRPVLDLRSTTEILKQTSSILWSHPLKFVFLALLIFIFRSNVENGTLLLTGFIDQDPYMKALLSRVGITGRNLYSPSDGAAFHHRHHRRHHRRPFLHLTRVGTLDDDFFSGDEDSDRSLFGSYPRTAPNGSSVFLSNFDRGLGFSNYVTDNGIRISELVSWDFSVRLPNQSVDDDSKTVELDEGKNSLQQGEDEAQRIVDLHFWITGLELPRHDASALFFLMCLLSTVYGYVIVWFVVTYSWVLGIVFIVVVNHFLERGPSWVRSLWDGSNLGLKRLSGFIFLRWAVRDALTLLLGLWFFGEIEDQYSVFKIFIRLKLMPFSVMSSWIQGFEKETAGFLFAWLLLDMVVEFIFAVDSWVAIVDPRRNGKDIMKEGCYLLSAMFKQAVLIKCFESIICGPYIRQTLARYFGKLFATAFQSVMEVYFMAAWLIYYLAVRSKDAASLGRTFGRRELEGLIPGRR